MNKPVLFFTSSFLYDFFDKYYDDISEGNNSSNQNRFVEYFQSSNGYIYFDTNRNNDKEYPILDRILKDPSQSSYRPYDQSEKVSINNIELDGIQSNDVGFTNTLTKKEIKNVKNEFFKPVFSPKCVENCWTDYDGETTIKNIYEGEKYKWSDILLKLSIPTSSIIIADKYIISSELYIRDNLIPILDRLSKLSREKINIIIISMSVPKEKNKYGNDRNKLQYVKNVNQELNRLFAKKLNCKVVIGAGLIKPKHDRRIVTDYRFINFPAGLSLLEESYYGGLRAIHDTEPSVCSIFNSQKDSRETFYDRRDKLLKAADRYEKQMKL